MTEKVPPAVSLLGIHRWRRTSRCGCSLSFSILLLVGLVEYFVLGRVVADCLGFHLLLAESVDGRRSRPGMGCTRIQARDDGAVD